MSKRGFVESLQAHYRLFSPHEISQKVRLAIGCVSICSFDDQLDVRVIRGYMKRDAPKPNRSAEDPELYDCVVSTNQSQAWQYTVWIKEILQIFDRQDARTDNREALDEALRMRNTELLPREFESPSHAADRNGYVLALGSAVPFLYRSVLRREKYLERYSAEELERLLFVPSEKQPFLLSGEFEDIFQAALDAC